MHSSKYMTNQSMHRSKYVANTPTWERLYNVEFSFGQNAEDNDYFEAVDPSLEFFINSEDITNTRTPATLLIFNNEKGFSSKNIDSICSVGRSPKICGYIGERYFT